MRERLRQGLGESSTFGTCHPIVNLIFFTFAVGITMFSMDPVFLAVTFVCSFAYSVLLGAGKAAKMNLLITAPILVVMALINTLFTHNGATVLFYLRGSRITLEALLYGVAAAVLLSAVVIWFSCFQIVMTSDKIIYLFGKAAPVLGLALSMIFRFIPLLKNRYREIVMGQRCMGRHGQKGLVARVRQRVKEVSILISWSLEASIETADSMEARGYGLHGRTSFHLFRFAPFDRILLVELLVLGILSMIGCAMGKTSIYFYPKVVPGEWDCLRVITLVSYCGLLLTPLLVDLLGEKKWQALKYEN